ncbi:DUF2723 domain-containing protein [uncultured Tenacibaculum sp.]|uniref:glycosyltransferase family 117 protein n=1 Tax=uncultured Tenacibaculum sp. TaxID=174713 RepID=UPI0026018418|nr:DUF2723 domain-containing protein [uncultured Tenacibaculum sp.]
MKSNQTIVSWGLFLISFIIYAICIPNSITFWDSPEFVVSNYSLQTTHPAGAPFYTLLNNVLIGVFFFIKPVIVSNLFSSLFGALSVVYLFKIITIFSVKVTPNQESIIHHIAGVIGSLSFAFCHSFWVASTETEVYTLSFFLLILIFWLLLKWEGTNNLNQEKKLLLVIFLLLGISLGVHLINLAIIIPLTLIFFNKKFGFTTKHILLSLFIGLALFFIFLTVLFQGTISLLSSLDIWMVNSLNSPVNFGATSGYIIIIFSVILSVFISHKFRKLTLTYTLLCLLMFYIGFSSYIMPLVRSQVNTAISNTTLTTSSLLKYIRAEQFGISNIPLLKGSSFNAPLNSNTPFLNGKPKFRYNTIKKKYTIIDDGKNSVLNYDKKFDLLFPRVFHKNAINKEAYKTWATIKGTPVFLPNLKQTVNKPTFLENLSFFYNYQVNWLYLRYLFQNFVGIQNTFKGTGNITKGNWASGFNFIDKNRIGDQSVIPQYFKNLNSKTLFYGFPFLLGLIGLYKLRKQKVYFLTSILLFLTFGVGITIYVNPVPQSILIRERDYIFAGSFIFFCIWIGLSVNSLFSLFNFIKNEKKRIITIGVITLFVSPIQLLAKGFDNHYRKKETFAFELGKAYLDGCPNQAILITNFDNMTFPLWYLQEVENYRTDVRIINFDQLQLDWYAQKLKVKINKSKPITLSLNDDFINSKFDSEIPLNKITNKYFNLKKAGTFLNNPKNKITLQGNSFYTMPTENLILPIRKNISLIGSNIKNLDTLKWSYKKNIYYKNELILLDIIGNNLKDRPICFAENGDKKHFLGLNNYLIQKGIVFELLPLIRTKKELNPKIVDTKTSFNNLVTSTPFKVLNNIDSKITDESVHISKRVLRRSYYFLAQSLIEEKNIKQAESTLNYCIKTIPNQTIPFHEFGFAIGKLYYRINKKEKGFQICSTAIKNIEDELKWILSFNPPRPIINVRYANGLMKRYEQMIFQIKDYNIAYYTKKNTELNQIKKQLKTWQLKNWPY